MDSMFTLGVVLSAKDMLTPVMGRAGESVTKLSSKIQAVSGKMAVLGTASYGMGRAMLSPVMDTLNAYQDLAQAQGDLGSLGIDASGIDAITKSAKEFSNQFAGDSAKEIVSAAYDIKSGISSLSDEGVAKFTKLSALTARATKATTGEMTSLFATGYGVYRKQFEEFGATVIKGWDKLSDEEKDIKFGEYFSAGIAQSVNVFKTDGASMEASISALGATATNAGVAISEQFSILGKLQQTMSGSVAATKYKAFLNAAVGASDKLGLSFTDANNKLLTTPEILEKLKEKYGETLDAMEKKEIKDAFGTDEAVEMIDILYNETDTLKKGIVEVNKAISSGTKLTEEMAKSRNKGHEFEILNHQITNLSSTIGSIFAPVATDMATVIGDIISSVQTFTQEHETATKVIAYTAAGLGTLLTVAGAVLIPMSAIGFALPAMAAGFGAVSTSIGFMGTVLTTVGRAFMLNPIGLVITAIAGAAYLIYDNWEPISKWFSEMWDGLKSIVSSSFDFMKEAFSWSPLGLVVKGYGAMFDWLESKFDWFSSAAETMGSIGSSIAGFFGFGDDEKKIEVSKKSTTRITPVVTTKQPGSVNNSSVSNINKSAQQNSEYNITVQVQSGDPQEIAHHVKRVVKEMESSRKNRSFEDEEI